MFYLEMVLLNRIKPTLTHTHSPRRKVKKYIRFLLLNAHSYQVIKLIQPCLKWRNLKKRRSFHTSNVEEAHGTIIVIIHILLIILSLVNGMNK